MKSLSYGLLIGVIIMITGCNTINVSMNIKKSGARAVGDMAATIALDMKKDNIDKEKIILFSRQIFNAIKDYQGEIITKDALQIIIEDKISNDKLKPYVAKLLAIFPNEINIKESKKLIESICTGLCIGATEWSDEDSK